MKGLILEHNCNFERLIEHTTNKVACEPSCEWWLERNVKLLWNVSSETEGKQL